MAAMHEPVKFLLTGDAARRAATDAEIKEMKQRLDKACSVVRWLSDSDFNTHRMRRAGRSSRFRVAARYGASCHVHRRHAGVKEPASSIQALEEVISAAAITGGRCTSFTFKAPVDQQLRSRFRRSLKHRNTNSTSPPSVIHTLPD